MHVSLGVVHGSDRFLYLQHKNIKHINKLKLTTTYLQSKQAQIATPINKAMTRIAREMPPAIPMPEPDPLFRSSRGGTGILFSSVTGPPENKTFHFLVKKVVRSHAQQTRKVAAFMHIMFNPITDGLPSDQVKKCH